MKIFQSVSVIILLTVVCSCGPLEDFRQFTERDIQPPVFISMGTQSPDNLEIQFSEEINQKIDYLFFDPNIEISAINIENSILNIKFSKLLEPGYMYKIEVSVSDLAGNSLTVLSNFYGYNSNLPDISINEFTCQGSSTRPDKVELKVLSDGNTAGMCIYEGIDAIWKQKKILPPIDVKKDEYIIIHFKPQGIAEEIDETLSKDTSGGLNTNPEAWDLWLEGGSGLSGNNGTITVFSNPMGKLIDGLIYSNRTSSSDDKYRGFGSTSTMNKADRLVELKGWVPKGDLISPEDTINPEDSTATRSICRNSVFSDTNKAADWHIVPTSTSSFGESNSDKVYIP